MAILYIIGTPIGNLGDITLRALETLRKCSLVAAEDTRQTLKLLSHYDIHTALVSCRAQNEGAAAEKILAVLKRGEDAAYCSDAGTPALSDPGAVLARRVTEAGFEVLPLPGPSAFASLVSVAGAADRSVCFEGFLSPKPGRRKKRLEELMARGEGFVVYESPYRIIKLFEVLAEIDKARYTCIGREMTKLHEEYIRGAAGQILEELKRREVSPGAGSSLKGEFSVYVSGYA